MDIQHNFGQGDSKEHKHTNVVASETHPNLLLRVLNRVWRVLRLLTIGYASEDAQFEYESTSHWEDLQVTLLRKLENVGVVSGLLLASNANLLISSNGELRRMTYASVAASTLGSLVSIMLDFLCLWALIGIHPSRLQLITRRSSFIYYYCGTPSLFAGGSALAFFTAIGSWVWLDGVNEGRNYPAKICTIVLAGMLAFNTGVCFYLGGSMRGKKWPNSQTYYAVDANEVRDQGSESPPSPSSSSTMSDRIAVVS